MTKYIAIQQLNGAKPGSFKKLARAYTRAELLNLKTGGNNFLKLDKSWLLNNGYSKQMVDTHCGTSVILSVHESDDGNICVKTEKSVYQFIPDFT